MDHIKLTSPHDTVNNPYLAAFLFSIRYPFLLILFGLLDIHTSMCQTDPLRQASAKVALWPPIQDAMMLQICRRTGGLSP